MLMKIMNSRGLNLTRKINHVKCLRNIRTTTANNLRFVQFENNGTQSLGVISENKKNITNLSDVDSSVPNNLVQFLERQSELANRVHKIITDEKLTHDLKSVRLLAPVIKPDKVICVGLNYKGHCDEQNKPYPEQPFFFPKFPSTIIGPYEKLKHPPNSKAVDWEVELAVVVGKKARNVKIENAYEYVFGYTVAQDISARDWQTPKRNNGQWLVAKSMDQFCPLGPAVVTKEEIPNPHGLSISCSINGVQKQNGNTDELIHRVDKLISFLSELFTLLPGDVILTGTPSGVGVFRNPREFLKPGDKILSEISSIGSIENEVI